jgi:hypothetical protein
VPFRYISFIFSFLPPFSSPFSVSFYLYAKCEHAGRQKCERKRLIARRKDKSGNNSKWILKEMRWEGVVELIHSLQDKGEWLDFVNTAMKLRAPQKAGNFE